MSLPKSVQGRNRPVIDAILPSVDGGSFPLKREVGKPVSIMVHALADGHDHLNVVFKVRASGSRIWQEWPMRDLGNDEFSVDWTPEEIGVYEYSAGVWVDSFRNWHVGFVKKSDAGDSKIGVELEIGAALLDGCVKRAKGEDKKTLKGWAAFLRDHDRDLLQKVSLARSEDLYRLAMQYPDRSRETVPNEPCLMLVERKKAFFSSWYEFFPRSTSGSTERHGTFRDAAGNFAEIARMGFDIVYMPPIHPIGKVNRKGKNNTLVAEEGDVGSPWAIGSDEGGHKAIHPELGSLEDFLWFREEAEAHGLEIALDIAFQCAPDHPYVKEHPSWFKWRPDGTVQYAENPPKKYQDILPFDFETEDWKALWEELKSVFDYWIEQGVKVFRVDNPHTKAMEFWRWCILEIKKEHPEVLFLSEAFTRPKRKYRLAKAGFTQGYTYFTWRNFAQEMREYVEELSSPPVSDFFLPNFWPNTPDILHEDLQKGNRATFLGRYVLAGGLCSNLGIYGPAYELMEQQPFPGKEEYNHNEKYEIKAWDWDRPGNLKAEIERVNAIRNSHPACHSVEGIRFVETDNPHFLAWIRQTPDRKDQLLFVVNFDWNYPQSGFLQLPLGELGIGPEKAFAVRDLLDPAKPTYTWRGYQNFVKLEPHKTPAHIFEVVV